MNTIIRQHLMVKRMLMQRDPEQTEVHYLSDFAHLKNAHLKNAHSTNAHSTNARILEVGCGDGRLTWRYAHLSRRVVAIDPDPIRLASAIEARPSSLQHSVTLLHADAIHLPIADNTFDGAILAWSL